MFMRIITLGLLILSCCNRDDGSVECITAYYVRICTCRRYTDEVMADRNTEQNYGASCTYTL